MQNDRLILYCSKALIELNRNSLTKDELARKLNITTTQLSIVLDCLEDQGVVSMQDKPLVTTIGHGMAERLTRFAHYQDITFIGIAEDLAAMIIPSRDQHFRVEDVLLYGGTLIDAVPDSIDFVVLYSGCLDLTKKGTGEILSLLDINPTQTSLEERVQQRLGTEDINEALNLSLIHTSSLIKGCEEEYWRKVFDEGRLYSSKDKRFTKLMKDKYPSAL